MFDKHELQNIISGIGSVRNGEIIQSITDYLRREKTSIPNLEKGEFNKIEETKVLVQFIDSKQLWFSQVDFSKYIGEGAEQRIFESSDPNFIYKLNDSIFYSYWEDYLHSLLIHNLFFQHLAYELCDFLKQDEKLYSVVKQAYVKSTEATDLNNVKEFMDANGFLLKKNNDYYNPELGIILEDLHDENVLTTKGVLQFIDTVFYLTEEFYKK